MALYPRVLKRLGWLPGSRETAETAHE